jgi:flagellin
MSSILTNIAAMSALQTLRAIGSSMNETQSRVSSGMRIATASDNAAYWSISTTMRSDNKAISAVTDALGLSGAISDTAYAATTSIVDILEGFKSRIVAATEQGVDRTKIQEELRQLNDQAAMAVSSASFNGVNWLQTSEASHLDLVAEVKTNIVSSFIRSNSGTVSVAMTDINLKTTSMLNTQGGGLLQKQLDGMGLIGGFRDSGINSVAHQGHQLHAFTGPATLSDTDFIEFDVVIDASAHSAGDTYAQVRIDKSVISSALGTTDGHISSASDYRKVLNLAFANSSAPASANETLFSGSLSSTSSFELRSLETSGHAGSSIDVTGVNSTLAGNFALGLERAPTSNHDNMYPQASFGFTKPFTVTERGKFEFDASVGPSGTQHFVVDHNTVNAALGTTDGTIGSANDLATLLTYVTSGLGLSIVSNGSSLTFSADQTIYPEAGNNAARVFVGNITSDPPWTLEFDLAEIDVTTDEFTIEEYLDGVEFMLQEAISSASFLGSLQARIDMQASFANTLMDSISSGIGRLIDADMNEESTRLKALQTQQQLAVQSLSIANANAENIITLFR